MQNAITYAHDHFDTFVEQLEDLLRIPSVSTDPAHDDDVRRAATWLVDELQRVGVERVELVETDGHPIVYAEHITDPAKPTVLVYGHYDVQPPDPLELWTSPPFEPVRKNGTLYARGASDDKGQMFMHVKVAEAYLQSGDELPVNLKYVIEGEEESGSVNLPRFIEREAERLKADVALISDTALFAEGVPSVTYGLRGMAYVEVTLRGPDRDLHSGTYGGAIENPINALARLIAGLHDDEHRITIPGFYDNVKPLSEAERVQFRELPFDEDAWKDSVGVKAVRHEGGYTAWEAITARPTLDVNGIWGGYTGKGAKTVLPSEAHAKISMRLVPDQTPKEIAQKLKAHLEAQVPDTMALEFRELHGGHGVVVDIDHPAMQAASEALEAVYDKAPFFVRNGGSIPVVADFKRLLGLDTVLLGFGLDSDAIHSPNEHFGLNRFQQGIESVIRFLDAYARKTD